MALVTKHDIAMRIASLSNDSFHSISTENNQTMTAQCPLADHVGVQTKLNPAPFIPVNPCACELIQDLFMDEESADIVIQVGEKQGTNLFDAHRLISKVNNTLNGMCGSEEQLTSPVSDTKTGPELTTFYAHKFILKKMSATLFELHKHGNPIRINGLSPDIFRFVLKHMYGITVEKDDMAIHAKDIIDAADWLKVHYLKLEAEAFLVESTTLTVDNVMDHLLYADFRKCALLKEAAMDFIIKNKTAFMKAVSIKDAPAGILADILGAVARGEKSGGDHLSTMRVSELRMKAHEKGLDLDGSREMLIAALEVSD